MFRKNVVHCMNLFVPGIDPEYEYYANQLDQANEVRRLMLEGGQRDVFTLEAPIAKNVAYMIEFEMDQIGEVDEIIQEHYLAGPNYCKHMTPTPEFLRWIGQNMREKGHREPHVTY